VCADAASRLEEIDTNSGPNVEKLLVGNKCDLAERRVVTYDQGKQLADSIGCKFVEVQRFLLLRLSI
jgi:Ras-related protein Rab-1A